jgi:hypothetical protein
MREILPIMIPIIALMIPIVAILSKHQQTMAQLIHGGSRTAQQDQEIAALKEEMRVLRETVSQQTLLLESINNRALRHTDDLADRIRTNA